MKREVPVRAILAAVWLTLASAGLLLVMWEVRKILFWLVLSVFLALVLNAPVSSLSRRGVRRSLSILAVSVFALVAVLGIATAIAQPLAVQGVSVAQNAPTYLHQLQTGQGPIAKFAHRVHLDKQLRNATPALSRQLSSLSSRLLTVGRRVASAAVATTIVLVMTIFLLVEGPATLDAALRLVPPDRRPQARRIGRRVERTVASYTLGILVLAVANGLVAALALWVMRVPFVLPLAVWAGAADVLPLVGGLFAIVPAALFAFARSFPAGIAVVAAMFGYQQVKNHVLYPIVVGRAVSLSALVVLLAVLVGGELSGITGALLAIPTAATINVALVELLGPRIPWLGGPGPVDQPQTVASAEAADERTNPAASG
jgi:predicted PurR-regulated permease PerM